MQLHDFMLEGSPRVGLRVRVRVPSSLVADLKRKRVRVGKDGTLVGVFRHFKADGRKVLVVLSVGRKLIEVRPQDAEGEAA